MRLKQIRSAVLGHGLDVYGAFHPGADDFSQAGTLILLGPAANFWDIFTGSKIYQDNLPDPIDRWSTYVISTIATGLDARPIFPFGGPPYAPFLKWAMESGRAWQSPVGMLVHDRAGLMVSYRGALAFDERLDLPDQTFHNPCETCADKPCLTTCPVDALDKDGYNVLACHEYLETDAGNTCMTGGCLVRRACPASAGAHRLAAQSALHMRAFLGET
jgi:epoxyqueuosine reductase